MQRRTPQRGRSSTLPPRQSAEATIASPPPPKRIAVGWLIVDRLQAGGSLMCAQRNILNPPLLLMDSANDV